MTDDVKVPKPRLIKGLYYWQAPKRYREMGYTPTNVRLIGRQGDGLDAERAAEAKRLTQAMVDHYAAKVPRPVATWADLMHRYRTDETSTIWSVKGNTRQGYLANTAWWEGVIGPNPIGYLTFEEMSRIHRAMQAKRAPGDIKAKITQLRAIVRYGVLIRAPGAREVKEVLSEMRFASAPPRRFVPTREMVERLIQHAIDRGRRSFAMGLMFQWHLALRLGDIRGIWLEGAGEGGIVREGKRWQDGLTWDMFAPDLSSFEKVISKTARSIPAPTRFALANLPELRAMLLATPLERRVGPVIVSERTGLPYTDSGWSGTFRDLAGELGLPREFKALDIRAGAITEAVESGADAKRVRDFAGHTQMSTTDLYMRGREQAVAEVIDIRARRA